MNAEIPDEAHRGLMTAPHNYGEEMMGAPYSNYLENEQSEIQYEFAVNQDRMSQSFAVSPSSNK
jgi:hypothetical protein